MVYQGEDLSSILYKFDESDFAISQFEGLRMDGSEIIDDDGQITTTSIVLEEPLPYKGSSCSNEATSNSIISCEPGEEVKKKKKGRGFLPGIVLNLSSRRKGAPQRAPLSWLEHGNSRNRDLNLIIRIITYNYYILLGIISSSKVGHGWYLSYYVMSWGSLLITKCSYWVLVWIFIHFLIGMCMRHFRYWP